MAQRGHGRRAQDASENCLQSETPCASPRWVCRAPAVSAVVIAATAVPRGTPGRATAALPSSSPAPRQYAQSSVTTGGYYHGSEGTWISRRNELGEACVCRRLRAKVLVSGPLLAVSVLLPFTGEGGAVGDGMGEPLARSCVGHPPPPCFAWSPSPAGGRGYPTARFAGNA